MGFNSGFKGLIFYNFFPLRKSCHLWHNVENIVEQGRPKMTIRSTAHCMLDTYGYKHILRLCNTSCLSTATIIARTCLSVTLYVHCLSCSPFLSLSLITSLHYSTEFYYFWESPFRDHRSQGV